MIPIEPFSKLDAWYNCPYGVPIISHTSWILFDGMSYVFGVEVIVGHDVHAIYSRGQIQLDLSRNIGNFEMFSKLIFLKQSLLCIHSEELRLFYVTYVIFLYIFSKNLRFCVIFFLIRHTTVLIIHIWKKAKRPIIRPKTYIRKVPPKRQQLHHASTSNRQLTRYHKWSPVIIHENTRSSQAADRGGRVNLSPGSLDEPAQC